MIALALLLTALLPEHVMVPARLLLAWALIIVGAVGLVSCELRYG